VTWTPGYAHAVVGGATNPTTGAVDSRGTTGRKKVMHVGVSWYTPSGAPTISDSAGNAFNDPVCSVQTQASVSFRMWRVLNPTTSATHTVTATGTSIFAGLAVVFSETDTAGSIGVDTGKPTVNTESNANVNVKPGTTTPSVANTLLVAMAGHGGITNQACSVLTLIDALDETGGTNFSIASSGKFLAVAAAQDPQFSWTTNLNNDHSAAMDVIKEGISTPIAITTSFTSAEIIPVDNGQTYATLPITFTYDETLTTPDAAELQLYASDGTTVLQSWFSPSSAPNFTGSPTTGSWHIPRGLVSKFAVRTKASGVVIETSSVTSTGITGVGYVFAQAGQSHLPRMERLPDGSANASSPPAASAGGKVFDGSTWVDSVGNGNLYLLNALISGTAGTGIASGNIPFGIVRSGVGGAGWGVPGGSLGVPFYTGGDWTDTSDTTYPYRLAFTPMVSAVRTGKVNGLILWGGSTDAVAGSPQATIYADELTTRNNLNSYLSLSNSQLPAFVLTNARANDGVTTNSMWDACVQTDLKFARDETNAYLAAVCVDLPQVDEYHLTAAGYGVAGQRLAQTILKWLGASSVDGGGLRCLTGYRYFGRNDIYAVVTAANGAATPLREADGSTDGTGSTQWQITFDGTYTDGKTVTATRYYGNLVVLTASSFPSAGTTVKFRYMYGANPTITSPVYDSTTPGGNTMGRTLAQSIGDITVTATDLGPMAWFEPWDRDKPVTKVKVESVNASWPYYVPTAGVGISGMAWFEPPDQNKPAVKAKVGAPPAGPILFQSVGISGIAWFEPPDQQAKRLVTPVIKSPPPSGPWLRGTPTHVDVGWFTPPLTAFYGQKVFIEAPPAFRWGLPIPNIPPSCRQAVFSIMRDTPVATSGAMSSIAVGVIADLC
jgi:hypothetical protein